MDGRRWRPWYAFSLGSLVAYGSWGVGHSTCFTQALTTRGGGLGTAVHPAGPLRSERARPFTAWTRAHALTTPLACLSLDSHEGY